VLDTDDRSATLDGVILHCEGEQTLKHHEANEVGESDNHEYLLEGGELGALVEEDVLVVPVSEGAHRRHEAHAVSEAVMELDEPHGLSLRVVGDQVHLPLGRVFRKPNVGLLVHERGNIFFGMDIFQLLNEMRFPLVELSLAHRLVVEGAKAFHKFTREPFVEVYLVE